jgi:hypothetical protein
MAQCGTFFAIKYYQKHHDEEEMTVIAMQKWKYINRRKKRFDKRDMLLPCSGF